MQNIALQWADGSGGDVADLIRWANGQLLLLVFGALNEPDIKLLLLAGWMRKLRCVQVLGQIAPKTSVKEHVVDSHGHLHAAVGGVRWALVRPDSYLAATGEQMDASLKKAVHMALGGRA